MDDRLTQWTPTGASLILDEPKDEIEARGQLMRQFKLAVNKLAAYEDTGLTPEEVAELAQMRRDGQLRELFEFFAQKGADQDGRVD